MVEFNIGDRVETDQGPGVIHTYHQKGFISYDKGCQIKLDTGDIIWRFDKNIQLI